MSAPGVAQEAAKRKHHDVGNAAAQHFYRQAAVNQPYPRFLWAPLGRENSPTVSRRASRTCHPGGHLTAGFREENLSAA